VNTHQRAGLLSPPEATTTNTPADVAGPSQDEAHILAHGIHSRGQLDAAMALPDKSITLITHLLIVIITARLTADSAEQDGLLTTLLSEPALSAYNLRYMTLVMRGRRGTSPDILTAICAHPRTDPDTVIDALWNAPQRACSAVGATSGTLLAAATDWVSRQVDAGAVDGQRLGAPTAAQRRIIHALAYRWGTRCAGKPSLAAFVATTAFVFTDEDELFAAGAAITAPPGV